MIKVNIYRLLLLALIVIIPAKAALEWKFLHKIKSVPVHKLYNTRSKKLGWTLTAAGVGVLLWHKRNYLKQKFPNYSNNYHKLKPWQQELKKNCEIIRDSRLDVDDLPVRELVGWLASENSEEKSLDFIVPTIIETPSQNCRPIFEHRYYDLRFSRGSISSAFGFVPFSQLILQYDEHEGITTHGELIKILLLKGVVPAKDASLRYLARMPQLLIDVLKILMQRDDRVKILNIMIILEESYSSLYNGSAYVAAFINDNELLHYATSCGCSQQIITYLTNRKGDLTLLDQKGNTVLCLAQRSYGKESDEYKKLEEDYIIIWGSRIITDRLLSLPRINIKKIHSNYILPIMHKAGSYGQKHLISLAIKQDCCDFLNKVITFSNGHYVSCMKDVDSVSGSLVHRLFERYSDTYGTDTAKKYKDIIELCAQKIDVAAIKDWRGSKPYELLSGEARKKLGAHLGSKTCEQIAAQIKEKKKAQEEEKRKEQEWKKTYARAENFFQERFKNNFMSDYDPQKEKKARKLLNVSENASEEEINKAYKKLIFKWHPDRFATETEEKKEEATIKTKEIVEAYETLCPTKSN